MFCNQNTNMSFEHPTKNPSNRIARVELRFTAYQNIQALYVRVYVQSTRGAAALITAKIVICDRRCRIRLVSNKIYVIAFWYRGILCLVQRNDNKLSQQVGLCVMNSLNGQRIGPYEFIYFTELRPIAIHRLLGCLWSWFYNQNTFRKKHLALMLVMFSIF